MSALKYPSFSPSSSPGANAGSKTSSLERHLEEKGAGYYHIIHFDCHGSLMAYTDIQAGVKRNRYTYQARWGREDIQPYEELKAFLFLDGKSKGKADPVEALELANLLTLKGIPVCILNACQSGNKSKVREKKILVRQVWVVG